MSFHALTHLSYSPISDSSINEPPVKPRIPVMCVDQFTFDLKAKRQNNSNLKTGW
jgi:hypothetical protein